MRIRKNASRLLASAYSVPQAPAPDSAHPFEPVTQPPMPVLAPCSASESVVGGVFASTATSCGETCELSRNPWDLIAQLSISDPQEEDPVDKYFVSVPCRASWLFPSSMPVASRKEKQAVGAGTVHTDSTSQPRHDFPKKEPKKLSVTKQKENEPKKKAKMKKEEQLEVKQPTYMCKKNDGKRWQCPQPVSHPNSLCDYHFNQKRAYLNPQSAALALEAAQVEIEVPQPATAPVPASKKPAKATSSKLRKKKPRPDFGATEGFYYYTGFGPFRSKRQYRSSGTNQSFLSVPPIKKEEEEEEENEQAEDRSNQQQAPSAAAAAVSSWDDIARIAGGDEESSDGDNGFGVFGRSMNGNGNGGVHCDGKRKNGWNNKRCRKPVKARSLKSLM